MDKKKLDWIISRIKPAAEQPLATTQQPDGSMRTHEVDPRWVSMEKDEWQFLLDLIVKPRRVAIEVEDGIVRDILASDGPVHVMVVDFDIEEVDHPLVGLWDDRPVGVMDYEADRQVGDLRVFDLELGGINGNPGVREWAEGNL